MNGLKNDLLHLMRSLKGCAAPGIAEEDTLLLDHEDNDGLDLVQKHIQELLYS